MADESPVSKFSGLAALLAGGYAAIAAVFTFLGVKDDSIGRMLREDPRAILCFGALVAAGVILGALAQKIALPGSLSAPLIVTVGAIPVLAFPWVADLARTTDVVDTSGNLRWILGPVVIAVLLAAVFLRSRRVDMNGVALIFGAVCFSLGSHGAVRLAADAASAFSSADIDAKIVQPENGPTRLEATVAVSGLRLCQELVVEINEERFASALAEEDGTASVKIESPLMEAWLTKADQLLKISAVVDVRKDREKGDPDKEGRAEDESPEKCEVDVSRRSEVVRNLPLPGASGAPVLKPTFGADRALTLAVSAVDQSANTVVRVAIFTTDARGECVRILASGALGVDGRGQLDSQLIAGLSDAIVEVFVGASTKESDSPPVTCSDLPTETTMTLAVPEKPAAASGGTADTAGS